MEQKANALKISSKVIAVIMKIGYIAMIVMMCICVSILIFIGATNGKTSIVTSGGTSISVADELSATTPELIAICIVYLVMGGFLFTIFLLANRMFSEISTTGDPFTKKYVKIVRAVGILVAAMTFAVGVTDMTASFFAQTNGIETYTEAPGLVVGAIIFCLSYIIDYGCALKQQCDTEQSE